MADPFLTGLENFEKEVIEKSKRELRQLVYKAFQLAVELSPVRSGSYVLSHTINQGAGPRPRIKKTTIGEAARTQALAYAAAKVQTIKKLKPVFISNNVTGYSTVEGKVIMYARNIEYSGWKSSPPYHVYSCTVEGMQRLGSANITR
jgi:hypothetical protein